MQVYHEVTAPTKTEPHGHGVRWEPACTDIASQFAGTLTISGKRNQCRYRVEEFVPGWDGRAFLLVKADGGTDPTESNYSLFIARNGQDRQCQCRGFQRFGHCRHLDALAALIGNGWL